MKVEPFNVDIILHFMLEINLSGTSPCFYDINNSGALKLQECVVNGQFLFYLV
jgi:hypothetical protein